MSNISTDAYLTRMAIVDTLSIMTAPSILYRPKLIADGDKWCVLLGDNLQDGLSAFGGTPGEAMQAFDKAFYDQRTPIALLAKREAKP